MRNNSHRTLALMTFLSMWTVPSVLRAQQDAAFAGFQFNRSLPGARSLAMGGAFVALADDATAAYSNPAGLTILARREISIEQRAWRTRNPFTDGGRISGEPSGIGLDTIQGLSRSETSDDTNNVSFLSYVETAPERRWALALYRHTLADYSARFHSEGVFSASPATPRFGPYRISTTFEVVDTGLAYAYQFGKCIEASGCLRLGGGLAYYDLNLEAVEEVLDDPIDNGPADFGANTISRAFTFGDDSAVAGNLGLIWQTTHSWRFAAAYRQGPDFEINHRIFAQPEPGRFRLPDQFVVGAAFQPTSALTISVEADRITYSSLLRNNRLEDFDLDDGTEVRLGVEYVLFVGDPVKPTRLALMAGGWSDPGHRISFSKPITTTGDLFRRAMFPAGDKRREHVSAGLGANFGNFQIDAGCDWSSEISTCALSAVTRF
jgi:long-chain fatty acid transport protein